ncbi:MAG: hypothetical protein LBV42_00890 [Methanobrevibacter sp.]|jgi:hypothetical protein|nr:hypothetical protein [Methanobrevibacter sp.]
MIKNKKYQLNRSTNDIKIFESFYDMMETYADELALKSNISVIDINPEKMLKNIL